MQAEAICDNYLSSHYSIDRHETGTWRDGVILRGVNLLDLTAQSLKLVVSSIVAVAWAVFSLVISIIFLCGAVLASAGWGVAALFKTSAPNLKEKAQKLAYSGAEYFGRGCLTMISTPVVATWKAVLIASDAIGLLFPSLGKWGRQADLKLNEWTGDTSRLPQAATIASRLILKD